MTVPTLTPRPQDHDIRLAMPFRRRTPSCPALRVSVLTKQYPVPRTSIDCGMNFYGLHYIVSSRLLSRWHCDKKDRRFFVHEIKFPRRFLWVMHKAISHEYIKGGRVSPSRLYWSFFPFLRPPAAHTAPQDPPARSSGQPPQRASGILIRLLDLLQDLRLQRQHPADVQGVSGAV